MKNSNRFKNLKKSPRRFFATCSFAVMCLVLSSSSPMCFASENGNNTPVLRQMSLPELLSYSTVPVSALSAEGITLGTGTGFVVNFHDSENNPCPMLIANKHVITNGERIELIFSVCGPDGLPTRETYRYEASTNDLHIFFHPVDADDCDVCAISISHIHREAQKHGKELMVFPLHLCNVEDDPLACATGPLSQLYMIGYPRGMRDNVNNQPIFRTGIAATNPRLDFDGKKMFYVDMAVFPGSSGSPVVLYNNGSILNPYNRSVTIDGQARYVLLGLISQQSRTFDEVIYVNPQTANDPDMKAYALVPMNLGYVIKAERILELQNVFLEMIGQRK